MQRNESAAMPAKADRGFDISDDLCIYGAKLEILAFTRGKKQLSLLEVEHSKRISQVRIHVECVIGLLKNKYALLQSTLPVCLIKHKHDNDFANIDKILIVCSALVNLCPSVVPYYSFSKVENFTDSFFF